ncbi:MAG: dihydrofolate reductase [Cyanobacteria bacterium SZAS-4]|nr:dihydrofolate reductase [Cyanobacteria bacterium SZAS-4]
MRKLIYAMTVSLDGYINAPDGGINWSPPDDELFRFHTKRVENTDVQLLGRRLYETMLYWETVDVGSLDADHLKFATIWKALPKIVISTTLESVGSNCRLVKNDLAEEISKLKKQPGKDIAVGGAQLAHACMKLNLIDEWHMFVCPVLLGGGTRYFPDQYETSKIELVETKTFGNRVVHLRYRRT